MGKYKYPPETYKQIAEKYQYKNFVPDDNEIENLQIMTASEHNKLHNGKRFN